MTTILARTGDFNPERDGAFDSLSRLNLPPLIDNSGGVVFETQADKFFEDAQLRGYHYGNGSQTQKLVREGDLFPDGTGPINLGETTYRANSVGQVAFTTQGARLLRAGPEGVVEIASIQQTLPDGSGVFTFLYTPDINDSGDFAFQGGFFDPGLEQFGFALLHGNENGLTEIIRSGEAAPGMTAPPTFFSNPELNNSGQLAFLREACNRGAGSLLCC